MSCSESKKSFKEKPEPTERMKLKNMDYVWTEVTGNPNLYCWIPASKSTINPVNLDIKEVNIQDIPPSISSENFEDIVSQLAEEAVKTKQKKNLESKNPTPQELVSADDPSKYPIVKDFIAKKGLKVYGGVAINAYLPKEEKIYNPDELPDYDFFSPNPWDDAVELADIFYKKGYSYVEARAGIHKGTYKVFVNMWPVADITFMPQKDFDKIKTKTIGGLKVVSPLKLLESMYKEFSLPFSNPDRWPKVAVREKLLQKWTRPLNKKFACSETLFSGGVIIVDSIIARLLEACYKFIIEKQLIFSGSLAYNTYIEVGGGLKRLVVNSYSALSENSQEDTTELFSILLKIYDQLETTSVYKASRDINNTEYSIYAVIDNNYSLICKIVHITDCVPFVKLLNRNIVSIDYLKYDLYDTTVFGDKQDIIDSKCKLQYLNQIQEEYYKSKGITELDKSPFQRFVINCKGPAYHNLKIQILNRWLDRVANKNNIEKMHTNTHRIIKIPREKIPENCKGKSKNLCKYPCAWNKYIGKCSGIPKGTYRPNEQDFDFMYEYE